VSPYTSGPRYEILPHCSECEDWIVYDKYDDEQIPGLLGTRQEMGQAADQLEQARRPP
jgi:hypothetical protein